MHRFFTNVGLLWLIAVGLPLIAGLFARHVIFSRDKDDSRKLSTGGTMELSPDPIRTSIEPWQPFEGSPS